MTSVEEMKITSFQDSPCNRDRGRKVKKIPLAWMEWLLEEHGQHACSLSPFNVARNSCWKTRKQVKDEDRTHVARAVMCFPERIGHAMPQKVE